MRKKVGQKGNVLILLLAFVGLAFLMIAFGNRINRLVRPILSQDYKNFKSNGSEDDLSLYTIPDDVLTALNKAKAEAKPEQGIRIDGPTYRIPILLYHYVEHVKDAGDTIRISLNTPPEVLDSQLKTLVASNYDFITASDLADILDGIKQAPPKPIMLTFDDGYRDFYTDAFPVLKKYNVRSVNYVISGFLDQPNYLTKLQLKEIYQSGIVEIGAHSVHHLALKGLAKNQQTLEIGTSRVQLEQILGVPIVSFAYPYGSFDLNAIQSVKQAGFRTSVSTIPGTQASNSVRFFVSRIRAGGRTGQDLLKLIEKD